MMIFDRSLMLRLQLLVASWETEHGTIPDDHRAAVVVRDRSAHEKLVILDVCWDTDNPDRGECRQAVLVFGSALPWDQHPAAVA